MLRRTQSQEACPGWLLLVPLLLLLLRSITVPLGRKACSFSQGKAKPKDTTLSFTSETQFGKLRLSFPCFFQIMFNPPKGPVAVAVVVVVQPPRCSLDYRPWTNYYLSILSCMSTLLCCYCNSAFQFNQAFPCCGYSSQMPGKAKLP